MKRLITIVLFLCLCHFSFAQVTNDSSRVYSILSSIDTTTNTIRVKGNLSSDIRTMTSYEKMLACYLTGNYQEILDAKLYEGTECRKNQINSFSAKIGDDPQPYKLLYEFERKLRETVINNYDFIIEDITRSQLSAAEKEFLVLNMENIKYFYYDKVENEFKKKVDNYNNQCEEYAKTYPESEYNGHVTHKMPYKLEASPFGAQITIYRPSIAKYPVYEKTAIDRGLELGIIGYRFTLNVLLLKNISEATKQVYKTLPKLKYTKQLEIVQSGISLGYIILDKDRFRITPFVSRSIKYPSTGIGINADLKLFRRLCPAYKPFCTYPALRVQYQFIPNHFEKSFEGVTGNSHILSIGLNITAQRTKRMKQ
ncbi:MAG: hypothetical protein MJZ31_08425 [Bacteroidales bacterium]|nr:hypothetical protein [Bacteroidales bacterium]